MNNNVRSDNDFNFNQNLRHNLINTTMSLSSKATMRSTMMNSQNLIGAPILKLSFYHKNYLLRFNMSVCSKALVSSAINYQKLQKRCQQIVSKQLKFSTSEEYSLVKKVTINYVQSFVQLFEEEKKARLTKDYLGQNIQEHLSYFDRKWLGNSFNYTQIKQNESLTILKVKQIIKQDTNLQKTQQKVNRFLFQSVPYVNQIDQKPLNIKKTLIWSKYLERILLYQSFGQNQLNQAQIQNNKNEISIVDTFLFIILTFSNFYRSIRFVYINKDQIQDFFIKTLLTIQNLFKLMQKFIDGIKQQTNLEENTDKNMNLLKLLNKLLQNFIKTIIFSWKNLHKLVFQTQNVDQQTKKSQQFIDAQTNYHIYKGSIFIQVLYLIKQNVEIKKLINIFSSEQQQTSNQNKSLILWLLDQQNQISKTVNIFQSLKTTPNSNKQTFKKLAEQYVSFLNHSILQTIIDQISPQKRNFQKRLIKGSNKLNPKNNFKNLNIRKNLFFIKGIFQLIKNILTDYIQGPSQNSQKKAERHATNELLLFVTETIRFQIPDILKGIQENIKQRKYKTQDSSVIKNILSKFTGTFCTTVSDNTLAELFTFENQQSSQNRLSLLPYYRIKQLLKLDSINQNDYMALCRDLLKDIKYLSKQYTEFRSGKFIVQKKVIQKDGNSLDQNWKNNFFKKKKQLKKEEDNRQNFYEVYYFNYDNFQGDSLIKKSTTQVGINVNLINYNPEQLRKLSQQEIAQILVQVQQPRQRKKSIKSPLQQRKQSIASSKQVKIQPIKLFEQQDEQQIKTPEHLLNRQLTLSLPEERMRVRKLSQSLEKSHMLMNTNNQMLKVKDEKIFNLFKQNQELIKVNSWYEEQLRQHEDKQYRLEEVIAQLVAFNKIRDQRLMRKRKQLHIFNQVIKQKIQKTQNFDRKTSHVNLAQTFRNSTHSLNRSSRDSSAQYTNQKSLAHMRLIKDLNKLSAHSHEKKLNDPILPPPPPPPIGIINGQATGVLFLPPPPLPPPLTSLLNLPPPPSISDLPPPPPFELDKIQERQEDKQGKQPKMQMKTFGWKMIDVTTVPYSFWQNVKEVYFDEEDLIANFSKTPQHIVPTVIATKQKQLQKRSLLKPDRVKNVQIGLKKAKLGYKSMNNLQKILYGYDQNYFDQDIIQCIISLLPANKQKEEFSELQILDEDKQKWTLPDYFMAKITKIQSYEERLKAIRFRKQFSQISEDLIKKVNVFTQFFQQVKDDKFLQCFLEYLLSIGNFLNAKPHKANAYGFRLQSIPKTYTLIGQDHQTSLFQFVLKKIFSNDQEIFMDYINHGFFDTSKTNSLLSLNIIEEDFKFISKECQNLQEIIIYSRKQEDNSSNYLLPFYILTQQKINTLKNLIQQAKSIFEQVLEFYCEKMSSQEMISFIKQFRKRVKQFVKVNMKKKLGNQQSRLSWATNQRYSTASIYN